MVSTGKHIDDRGGGESDIHISATHHSEVVHLFDPLCRSVDTLRGEDLKLGVVAVVFDIASRGYGECFLIMQDFILQY